MKSRTNKLIIILTIATIAALMLTACGKSEREKMIDEVSGVDINLYMEEDQAAVKELKEKYAKDIEKAKDDKSAKKLVKKFNSELEKISTKEQKISDYKDLVAKEIEKLDADKKKAAKAVMKDYEDKLSNVKSDKELADLSKEIAKELSEKAKIKEDAISQPEAANNTGNENNGAAAGQTQQAQSGGNYSSAGSTTTQKQRVWVVDKAAWTETVVDEYPYEATVTVYGASDGTIFETEAEAYAYYRQKLDSANPVTVGPTNVTRTLVYKEERQVYHPEEGHWEYR